MGVKKNHHTTTILSSYTGVSSCFLSIFRSVLSNNVFNKRIIKLLYRKHETFLTLGCYIKRYGVGICRNRHLTTRSTVWMWFFHVLHRRLLEHQISKLFSFSIKSKIPMMVMPSSFLQTGPLPLTTIIFLNESGILTNEACSWSAFFLSDKANTD